MFDNLEQEKSEFVERKILEELPGKKLNRYDRINIRCPVCGDSKKSQLKARGWFYKKTNSYYCFNCNYSNSGFGFLADVLCMDIKELNLEFYQSQNEIKAKPIQIPTIVDDMPKIEFEKIFIPRNWIETDISKKYFEERKLNLSPRLPRKFKFYHNTFNNRIGLPWIFKGQLIYYQERKIENNDQPKYLFPKGIHRPIFGLDLLDLDFPYVFILEGLIDTMFVKNGICVGSAFPSKSQMKFIKDHYGNFEPVILTDNPYKDKTSKEQLLKLVQMQPNVKVFSWDKKIKQKDVNQFFCETGEPSFYQKSFLESSIENLYSEVVKLSFSF